MIWNWCCQINLQNERATQVRYYRNEDMSPRFDSGEDKSVKSDEEREDSSESELDLQEGNTETIIKTELGGT